MHRVAQFVSMGGVDRVSGGEDDAVNGLDNASRLMMKGERKMIDPRIIEGVVYANYFKIQLELDAQTARQLDPHKMTTDELYKELSEGYAREAGEKDGAQGVFDPDESYGWRETLAYQKGYDTTYKGWNGLTREVYILTIVIESEPDGAVFAVYSE